MIRCTADVARIRHSRSEYGLGFHINVLDTFEGVPFFLGRVDRGFVLQGHPGWARHLEDRRVCFKTVRYIKTVGYIQDS